MSIDSILPGRLCFGRGTAADYDRLARFHYRAGRPAFGQVFVVRYHAPRGAGPSDPMLVAVGVLSHPTPACRVRERFFGVEREHAAARITLANLNVRTISRLIVHPQFRSLGLGVRLVRRMIQHCPTRYVEAIAHMGHVHPLFERAGMTRVDCADPSQPAYFIVDRIAADPRGRSVAAEAARPAEVSHITAGEP